MCQRNFVARIKQTCRLWTLCRARAPPCRLPGEFHTVRSLVVPTTIACDHSFRTQRVRCPREGGGREEVFRPYGNRARAVGNTGAKRTVGAVLRARVTNGRIIGPSRAVPEPAEKSNLSGVGVTQHRVEREMRDGGNSNNVSRKATEITSDPTRRGGEGAGEMHVFTSFRPRASGRIASHSRRPKHRDGTVTGFFRIAFNGDASLPSVGALSNATNATPRLSQTNGSAAALDR